MTAAPKSLTHAHIFNCIRTEVEARPGNGKVRILDAGCGSGEMIAFLHEALAEAFPAESFEIFGFDVVDHGVQEAGFLDRTVAALSTRVPGVDWRSRIKALAQGQSWGFEQGLFDFVVSNQVLEHVHDKASFFAQIYACLKVGGYSFHLAPLRHCVHEGHIWLPFAHRIRSYELLYSYIYFCSRLGLGKFRAHQRLQGATLQSFSRRHADYMMFLTSYSSQAETMDLARRAGFRVDFRYTKEFYFLKILQILRKSALRHYGRAQNAISNAMMVLLLRYVSSVTLRLQRDNEY